MQLSSKLPDQTVTALWLWGILEASNLFCVLWLAARLVVFTAVVVAELWVSKATAELERREWDEGQVRTPPSWPFLLSFG